MNFDIFEKNILDVIKEEQIKLGYRKEPVTVYYMHRSVNRMLDIDADSNRSADCLEPLKKDFSEKYGPVEIASDDRRITVTVSAEVSEYVHLNIKNSEFIVRFIRLIERHNITIEQIYSLFLEYSDRVHFEKKDNGEFDYLIYFEDGNPDSYRYCLTDETVHFIYHRYTEFDYDDFGF